ncbi:hypothetical protein [Nocardia farcinica]|uniref:hypothetical protein n=1 Tax=Nocardia farcinica TaxID=37329 RepID=UPI0024588D53|nr:hypothetical protein [Nocardia farcinica]
MMEPHILPPAETTYKDWVGTAAAENSMLTDSVDLYELAGLGQGDVIIAIDAFAHSHGEPPDWSVRVYAVDIADVPEGENWAEWLADEDGNLPVREIALHNATMDDVIRAMKLVHFQLRLPHVGSLKVVEQTDFPQENPY